MSKILVDKVVLEQALEQLKIIRTNFRKGPSKSICKMLAENLKRDEVSYRERLHNRYCTGDMEEETFREKFAELIVRECIRLCDQVDIVGADECIDNIKEHFGVEE